MNTKNLSTPILSLIIGSYAMTITTMHAEANFANDTNSKFDSDFRQMINTWAKGSETNGLICGIEWIPFSNKPHEFCVNVINTTTNWVQGYLDLPLSGECDIDLFNSHGKAIKKTSTGAGFGIWSSRQIEDWLNLRPKKTSFFILPLNASQVNETFSITQLFELKQSGEYTLHLRLGLIQRTVDASKYLHFQTNYLPEVTTKIQIHLDDIAETNSTPK